MSKINIIFLLKKVNFTLIEEYLKVSMAQDTPTKEI